MLTFVLSILVRLNEYAEGNGRDVACIVMWISIVRNLVRSANSRVYVLDWQSEPLDLSINTARSGQVASSGVGIEPAEHLLQVVETDPVPNEEADTSSDLDIINVSQQTINFDILQPELDLDLPVFKLVVIGKVNWISFF